MRSCKGMIFVVAGHHGHGAELQPFGEVHGADRNVTARRFDMFIENLEWHPAPFCGGFAPIQLRLRSDKQAEFVRQHARLCLFRKPVADRLDFLAFGLARAESSAAGR